jgi:hypothetical protein
MRYQVAVTAAAVVLALGTTTGALAGLGAGQSVRYAYQAASSPPTVPVATVSPDRDFTFHGPPTPRSKQTPLHKVVPKPTPTPTYEPSPTPTRTYAPSPSPTPTTAPVVVSKSPQKYALDQVGPAQFVCLYALWNKESGWNPLAANPSSSAYGIPQANPGSKMASAGSDWQTNPITQIVWGLGYIRAVYGTPCSAWAHSQATNWY